MLPDDYRQQRGLFIDMYKSSMQTYDKLVPWGAGGALVLSITLLGDLASASTRPWPLLGASWIALLLSLTTSIVSHFTSSRVYSSERAALDIAQRGDTIATADYGKHKRIVEFNNRITYWLNYISGGSLLIGLVLLGVFVYRTLSLIGGKAP